MSNIAQKHILIETNPLRIKKEQRNDGKKRKLQGISE